MKIGTRSQRTFFLLGMCFALVPTLYGDSKETTKPAWSLDRFWEAKSARQARRAIRSILEAEPRFEEVYSALKAGRTYGREVETGLIYRTRTGLFHYTAQIPETYDPTRRYPVRVLLHGGIAQPAWRRDGSWWKQTERLAREDVIVVFPAGWNEARWWQESQVDNLAGILRELRRDYNLDENRASLLGVSDGGTGAYFQAFRAPTPWASFVPLIGHPAVLSNPATRAEGQLHVTNLRNRPFLAINGGKDRLYPSRNVRPFAEFFQSKGVDFELVDREESGHTVAWWPEEAARIDRFLDEHPRQPLPDRLTWEVERTDRDHRLHWLVMDELGEVDVESVLDEPDRSGRSRPLFPQEKASGRVDLVRTGQRVEVRTRGVRRFSLLLSPDQFDFEKPIHVITNGRESFHGRVTSEVATLLEWAFEDQDRTMLFGARLEIQVP